MVIFIKSTEKSSLDGFSFVFSCFNMNTNIFRNRISRFLLGISANKIRCYSTNIFQGYYTIRPRLVITSLAFSMPLFSKDEETPVDKLIETIKRSVLCIQREEYAKAEQMLHLALRMAQDQNNQQGITYIYDVMGNLAMERDQFKKAEKLFVDVMKRLYGEGYPQDGLKMLHISAKIARMAYCQGNLEKALQGFDWCIDKINEKLKTDSIENDELTELLGMTSNWLGDLLMKTKDFAQAKKCFERALYICEKYHGRKNAEALIILNNLSVACTSVSIIILSEIFNKL